MENIPLDGLGTVDQRRTAEFQLTKLTYGRLFDTGRKTKIEPPVPGDFVEPVRDLFTWAELRGVPPSDLLDRLVHASNVPMLPLATSQPTGAGRALAERLLRRVPEHLLTPLPWVPVDVVGPFLVVGHFCPYSTNFAGLPEDLLIRVQLTRADYDRVAHLPIIGEVMRTRPAIGCPLPSVPVEAPADRHGWINRILQAGCRPDGHELERLERGEAIIRIEADPAMMLAIDQRIAGVRTLPTVAMMPSQSAFELIPRKIATTMPALCYYVTGRTRHVLLSDAAQASALEDELAQATGEMVKVEACQVEESEIRRIMDQLTGATVFDIKTSTDTGLYDQARILEVDPGLLVNVDDEEAIHRLANDEERTKEVVAYFLLRTMTKGASDLHFDPIDGGSKIRSRLHGVCSEMGTLRGEASRRCIAAVKEIAKLNQQERRLPQDGQFLFIAGSAKAEVRVSTVPVKGQESLAMRIQPQGAKRKTIDTLGMTDPVKALFMEGVTAPHGIIVICGETGSGKTTTLDAWMRYLNRTEKTIFTMENPVEMAGDLMKQVEIRPEIGLDFKTAFRAGLRQDPDIMMIGEVRDAPSADAAIEGANTGHLLFCTMHTNDAPQTVQRFLQLGVAPDQLSACLVLAVAQTLVRVLCGCATKKPTSDDDRRYFFQAGIKDPPPFVMQEMGCAQCGGTGYNGQRVVMEMMPKTEELEALIFERAGYKKIKECARRYGYRTLFEESMALAAEGITSVAEARLDRMPYLDLRPTDEADPSKTAQPVSA